ncbi:VOC family protein [Aeromicrobium flavum]|nr:VOC family protein [Aeromicrobium flavum]
MSRQSIVVSLPIGDRRTSLDFYERVLGLQAFGEPADDGVPEPLQFSLSETVSLMLVPTGGFGWGIGGREVAPAGQHECAFSVSVAAAAEVDAIVERARQAGAEIVTDPGEQPWGYTASFTDPDGHLWSPVVAELSDPKGSLPS